MCASASRQRRRFVKRGRRRYESRKMHIHPLITDSESLEKLCERLARSDFVAVDTEFMRENTYWPELCLIQVANSEEAAAIDPKAEGIDLTPLLNLLVNNEHVLKVFHAGGQDIEIIFNLTGGTPHPLFDTQVAAMALGLGEQVGYPEPGREPARPQPRQGRALHRLGAPAARQAPDRLCDRRRHPSRRALPQDARAAAADRPRRLARPGDGAARRPGQLHQRSGARLEAGQDPDPARRRARPAEGARRLARDRGARQESAARPDHEGRDAGRRRRASAGEPGGARPRCAASRRPGAATISARG